MKGLQRTCLFLMVSGSNYTDIECNKLSEGQIYWQSLKSVAGTVTLVEVRIPVTKGMKMVNPEAANTEGESTTNYWTDFKMELK